MPGTRKSAVQINTASNFILVIIMAIKGRFLGIGLCYYHIGLNMLFKLTKIWNFDIRQIQGRDMYEICSIFNPNPQVPFSLFFICADKLSKNANIFTHIECNCLLLYIY